MVVGYGGAVAVLLALEDRLLFHPVKALDRWIDPPTGCAVEDIYLTTEEGLRIHGRWWPCEGAKRGVLFCHSRSGNVSLAFPPEAVAQWHREMGAWLFVFDYPGYGRSQGSPSEAGCYAAADAAYTWLTEAQQIKPRDLLIVGRSLGTRYRGRFGRTPATLRSGSNQSFHFLSRCGAEPLSSAAGPVVGRQSF
jgi:hypothetical protein